VQNQVKIIMHAGGGAGTCDGLITRRGNISRVAGETSNRSFIDQTMGRPKSLRSAHNPEIVPRGIGIGAGGSHAAA